MPRQKVAEAGLRAYRYVRQEGDRPTRVYELSGKGTLYIDFERLFAELGQKALRNRRGLTRLLGGALVVEATEVESHEVTQ